MVPDNLSLPWHGTGQSLAGTRQSTPSVGLDNLAWLHLTSLCVRDNLSRFHFTGTGQSLVLGYWTISLQYWTISIWSWTIAVWYWTIAVWYWTISGWY